MFYTAGLQTSLLTHLQDLANYNVWAISRLSMQDDRNASVNEVLESVLEQAVLFRDYVASLTEEELQQVKEPATFGLTSGAGKRQDSGHKSLLAVNFFSK